MSIEYTFSSGCMWEGFDWKISMNVECSELGGREPCRHCHDVHIEQRQSADGDPYTEKVWICPAVVIAINEGGCASTGMCLQCILEAAKTTPELEKLCK